MPLTQVSSRLIEDTLRYVLGASGTDHYKFTGKGLTGAVNDPTLTLSRGHTYIFENRSGGHPFYIKTSIANGGTNDQYSTGVTNNGGGNGTEIIFTVPHDAPDTLYYQCSSHSSMSGQLSISGSVADGSITESKLADDAVTADKLANSINTAIAANTAKTSNATHTGEVTGATALTIADDVVDEANLKVSNTPTNGYFLSAQSGNTGGLTWAEAGGGKILQVVTGTTTTQAYKSNDSSLGDTGLTASITPSSGTKILVIINQPFYVASYNYAGDSRGRIKVLRDSTSLTEQILGHDSVSAGWFELWTNFTFTYLDTHGANGSTAVTYKTQYAGMSNVEAYVQRASEGYTQRANINLLEVAA